MKASGVVASFTLACLLVGCSGIARTFLDLPPPEPEAVTSSDVSLEGLQWILDAGNRPPPALEFVKDPDSVLAMLPRDRAGNADWMQAVRDGLIRPRTTRQPDIIPLEPRFQFGFDFYFPGPDTLFDAFFPHSSHTQWVDCRHCHGRIFKYRDTPIEMKEILRGKYCGECHGKVAFPVTTGCDRCHTNLELPENWAEPALLGDIVMRRVQRHEVIATEQTSEQVKGVAAAGNQLPPAVFPHWVHRIRYQCKVCHVDLFEPRAGANQILMQDIADGRACGTCHNDKIAFRPTIGNCDRCHSSPQSESMSANTRVGHETLALSADTSSLRVHD